MTIYYPQAMASLRVLWENFGNDANPFLNKEYEFNITPRRTTVTINDYTKADEFRIELDYRNFPFDPRTIRACGVSIFIQDMKQHYDRQNQFRQIEPKSEIFSIAKGNAIFAGFADEDSIEFNDTTRTITMEGRDFTGILIDTPYDNKEPLPKTTPLDNVFQQILLRLPATRSIKVNNIGADNLPALAQFAPDFNPLGTVRSKERNETYWDVIQALAKEAGVIAYIDRDALVITKPNALYDRVNLKQFIWGKNIKDLSFKRKLGRMKTFNVGVRSMNLEQKKVLEAKIPKEASITWSQKTGIPLKEVELKELLPDGKTQTKIADYITFRLPNVASQSALVDIGEKIYEELSRQQIEGRLTTKDMAVPEGDTGDGLSVVREPVEFDCTKIRVGTPIDIRIDQDDLEALANIAKASVPQGKTDLPQQTVEELTQYLIKRRYDPKIAYAFASSLIRVDTPFYTKSVEFTLDAEQGFSMDLDFINFIELPQSLGVF